MNRINLRTVVPTLCLCGCGNTFIATNSGSIRLYFEHACRQRVRQRRWAAGHPDRYKAGKKKWQAANQVLLNARRRKRYALNIDDSRKKCREKQRQPKYRDSRYRRKFGISLEEYGILLKQQEGCCAICGTRDPGPKHGNWEVSMPFVVDHCHETQRVRGLLCEKCNRGLGQFDDDIDRIRSAIEYLQKGKV